MHPARRAVCLNRPLVRNASSAAAVQLAPKKWARPDPGPSTDDNGSQSAESSVPRARSWGQQRSQDDSPLNPTASYSDPPRSRSWARRVPVEPRERGTDTARSTPRTPQRDSPRLSQRDALPHLAQRVTLPHLARRDAAPHQRDVAPHQRDAAPHRPQADRAQPANSTRSQQSKGKAAWKPLTAATSRGKSSFGNILSKKRIDREFEDAQALEEEKQGQADADQVVDVEDDGEVQLAGDVVVEEGLSAVEEIDDGADGAVVQDRVKSRSWSDRPSHRKENERGSVVSKLERGKEEVVIHKRARTRGDEHIQAKAQDKRPKPAKSRTKKVQRDLFIPTMVTVANFARLLKVTPNALRRRMRQVGMNAEASNEHLLTSEYASLLAMEFGWNPVVNDEAAFDIYPPPLHPEPLSLPTRPPIVTIMGHVDHGKTTLLDTLRSASVAKGEAGGITQHIGAFSVPVPGDSEARTITFLDTPGHAAFSAMRARGAGVTDIVVLVVAADDGIMPQTREVIDLINKENVGVVVAINKVDKPGVDVSKVEHALLAEGVQLETFGGDIPSVQVSGLTGQGLDQLVETISALAEMQDLRAERDGPVHGYILESKVQKGLGPVATVLVLRGCLKPTDHIIAGLANGKVRLLHDSHGKPVKLATPAMAVTVSGWKELPNAGDEVLKGSEADIKKALANRERKADLEATLGDLEVLNEQRRQDRDQKEKDAAAAEAGEEVVEQGNKKEDGPKELRLIIKADVSGSAEAVSGALQGIGNDIAHTKIISTGVGDVTESDVMRAKTSGAMIVAFSVGVPRPVQSIAASQQVPWITSTIIYRLMDDVKGKVIELLPPIIERRVTGEANVLQLFDISLKAKQTMKVAGCRVTNGTVVKNKIARVIRNGECIYEGRVETLKQHKNDVDEVAKGTEFGLAFGGFSDLREGDKVQMFQKIEKPGVL